MPPYPDRPPPLSLSPVCTCCPSLPCTACAVRMRGCPRTEMCDVTQCLLCAGGCVCRDVTQCLLCVGGCACSDAVVTGVCRWLQNTPHLVNMLRYSRMIAPPKAVTYSFDEDRGDDTVPTELQAELVASVKLRDTEVALRKQTAAAVAAVVTQQAPSYFAGAAPLPAAPAAPAVTSPPSSLT